MSTYTLAHVAQLLGAVIPAGSEQLRVTGVATLADAGPQDLALLGSETYLHLFPATRAVAVIAHRHLKLPDHPSAALLRVDDPDLALAKVLALFAPPVSRPDPGIDPSARIDPTAVLSPDAVIGPHVVIGRRCRVGASAVLHAGVFLGDDVTLGDACEFFPHVVVRERITIGSRVVIHAGSVLGTDGFGYRWDGNQHQKIPQIGTVIIEDDVEIGSCVCIDRAKVGATRIGHGTKIDNLVQVGHNVQIGPHCILAGLTGVAGSTVLGRQVVLAGGVGVRDHVTLGDHVTVAAYAAVASDVPAGQVVCGIPAIPHRDFWRLQGILRRLPDLVSEIRQLKKEVAELKKKE